tara:strand:- start:128 stop:637 length:510 start_codon:yes stop_codon:yes gene_type:complete
MIYVNIGSNLKSKYGDRMHNIKLALKLLKLKGIDIIQTSSFYTSPSYPNKFLPKFLNLCAEIKSLHSPEKLIKIFKNIEKKIGRLNKARNSPRVCDIDIIDFNNRIIKNDLIEVPHPRMHLRNFVLLPLNELNPYWQHPIYEKKIYYFIKSLNLKSRLEITRLKKNAII